MSKINAATRISLEGSPVTGFVLWQSVTLPPKTVAHEELDKVAMIKIGKNKRLTDILFIL